MPRDVYDEFVSALLEVVGDQVQEVAPQVDRGVVAAGRPLTIALDDDVVITEGDPDVEIDRALLADRPSRGAIVRVSRHDGDYIVAGVNERGDED